MTFAAVPYAGAGYASEAAAMGAAGAQPTRALEWSPSTSPFAEPAWEPIPLSDIRSLSFTRGRERELDEFRAGSLTVLLDNRDRAYDPQHNTDVKPMVRVRYRETYAGVTYDLFDGYVDGWDQNYEKPREATATLRATDGFKVLAAIDLQSSVYEQEVTADTPVAWFRLEEESDATQVIDSIAGIVGTLKATPTLGSTGLRTLPAGSAVTFDSIAGIIATLKATPTLGSTGLRTLPAGSAVTFDNAADGIQTTTCPLTSTGAWTIECLVDDLTATGSHQSILQIVRADGRNGVLIHAVAATNVIGVAIGTTVTVSSTATVTDGLVHHIAVTHDGAGTYTVYVDGAAVSAIGSTVDLTGGRLNLGYSEHDTGLYVSGLYPNGEPVLGMVGVLDEVAFYTTALSATRIAAHNEAARTPWDDDTTGERTGRILDAIGWPGTRRELDTGQSTCQSTQLTGTALSYLQKIRETEEGAVFMSKTGDVRFIERAGRFNQDTAATFGDGGGTELPYAELTFDYEDQELVNEATVSRDRGIAITARDTTSIDTYLTHSLTKEGLLHDSEAESQGHAQFLVDQRKDPALRITEMVILPQRDSDSLFPAVLARELGDQIRVLRRPQGVGSTIDQDLIVEGISWTVLPKHWEIRWQLSSAENLDYWLLGAVGASEIGTTTKVAF